MKTLWVEEFRPKTVEEYVFRDAKQKQQVKSWIESGAIPHLLFTGVPGSGKTTLGKVLLCELNVDPFDIRFINGSTENGVDEVRTNIVNFAMSMGVGDFKYVFIDEADYLSPNAQAALRNTMETFSNSCRFIFTANYANKIIPALHSRCQGFHIEKLDVLDFYDRTATILKTKGVKFETGTLELYVAACYPDLRKCINLLQMNSQTGRLAEPATDDKNESDYKLTMIAMFKERMYTDARKLICSQVRPEEYEDLYRFFYQHLEYWTEDKSAEKSRHKEHKAILAIRNGLVKHTTCADSEINLSATLVELELIADS